MPYSSKISRIAPNSSASLETSIYITLHGKRQIVAFTAKTRLFPPILSAAHWKAAGFTVTGAAAPGLIATSSRQPAENSPPAAQDRCQHHQNQPLSALFLRPAKIIFPRHSALSAGFRLSSLLTFSARLAIISAGKCIYYYIYLSNLPKVGIYKEHPPAIFKLTGSFNLRGAACRFLQSVLRAVLLPMVDLVLKQHPAHLSCQMRSCL